MCGIFLIYNKRGFLKDDTNNYIKNAKLLNHKEEKDSYRIVNNKYGSILLYHNKVNSLQPIIKNNIMIVADGKIYNYNDLYNEIKTSLPSYNFKSKSNAEILIPLYLLHGSGFISKIRGIFSFVLYDATKNILIVVRDHIGIASLYYVIKKNEDNDRIDTLMISSEMKALNNLSKNINIFEPGKVYINGTFFTHYNPKWKELDYIPTGEINYNEIKQKLIDSVLKYILSDDPIGIILTGDLISSIISSIIIYLKKNNFINNSIKTYSIKFKNTSDTIEAENVSEYITHTTYTFTIDDIINSLEDVIYILETYDVNTIRSTIPLYLLFIQIKKNTDIKVFFTEEVSDIIFNNIINKRELLVKLENKVNILYKTSIENDLELMVPFADRDIIEYIMNINLDKNVLIKMFDNNVSDTDIKTNDTFISSLKSHADEIISNNEFNNKDTLFPINTPINKEAFLYRKIFENKIYIEF
jgi:asparagine synthase (glutamine-hydrolysing)